MTRTTKISKMALALAAASLTTLSLAADPIKIGVAGPVSYTHLTLPTIYSV